MVLIGSHGISSGYERGGRGSRPREEGVGKPVLPGGTRSEGESNCSEGCQCEMETSTYDSTANSRHNRTTDTGYDGSTSEGWGFAISAVSTKPVQGGSSRRPAGDL